MLKFVKTSACKPCKRGFASKSLDFEDSINGFYHSTLEGRRSISYDNIHALTTNGHFSSSTDEEDDDCLSISDSFNPLMVSGSYNTLPSNVANSTALRMMFTLFKPRTAERNYNEHDYRESVREGRHSVTFYMNQLCRHLDPQMRMRSPPKKLLKGLISIEKLLTSLEVDLRSNPNATWLREFIDEPNCGHVILLKFLKYLQEYSTSGNTTLERSYRNKKSELLLAREPTDEHSCLLCLKAIVRNKYGFQKVLSAPRSLSTMVYCLRLSNIKTKIAVLKILSEACEHTGGFDKTLQAFEDYKQVKQEKFRFESVVHSVIFRGRLNNPAYIETVLLFFNALMRNAPTLNQRVFHQQELEQAGFTAEKVEQTLDGLNADGLREELNKWRNNYIDVANTLDEYVLLRGRSSMLRDEVDLLQSKVDQFQREKNNVLLEKQDLEKKVEKYKIRASELHLRIANIKRHQPENLSEHPSDITHAIEDAVEEILRPSTPLPPPPPTMGEIPEAPLPPPLNFTASKDNGIQFRKSSARLPMLHWQTIPTPSHNSIFSNFSPNALENKINFEEFDELFELNRSTPDKPSQDVAVQKQTNQVTVLNNNKSRSLLIAKKRIKLSEYEFKSAIDSLDIINLPPDNAELLVKLIPTTEERAAINNVMGEYEKMGDAERFMVQLLRIDRVESKLNTMVYMGTFDELFRITSPQIEAIISASVSLATSSKMKKILEVILTFGNYINGKRRGFTKAFKLESLIKLNEVKSNNKKLSLLQYIVTVVQTRFPELQEFDNEIDVQPTQSISMETLAADVQNLRKGLDVAKMEKEKQPNNYALHNFYDRAVLKVQQVGERYRQMEEQFRDVCTLFCENPKTTEPAVFFSTFHKFIVSYNNAKEQLDVQNNAERALRKAKLLQAQNQKLKETSNKGAETIQRRHSEFYDQNQNLLQQRQNDYATGSTMSLDVVAGTDDRLSISLPRSTLERMLSTENYKEENELQQCPLFNRTKCCSESEKDSDGTVMTSPRVS